MTSSPTQRFRYVEVESSLGSASALPYVPIVLSYGDRELATSGLVDSGATLNVLPYDLGLRLGAVWERQTVAVRLSGILADAESRALVLHGKIGQYTPVRLAFAWTRTASNHIPLILGQVNFFMEFDVWFSRSRFVFGIGPKDISSPEA